MSSEHRVAGSEHCRSAIIWSRSDPAAAFVRTNARSPWLQESIPWVGRVILNAPLRTTGDQSRRIKDNAPYR